MQISRLTSLVPGMGFKGVSEDTYSSVEQAPDFIVGLSGEEVMKLNPEQFRIIFGIYPSQKAFDSELLINLKAGKEAVNYVKSMNLKSPTAMEFENPFIKYRPTSEYKEASETSSYLDNSRRNLPIDKFVKVTVEKAPRLKVGNCTDQAILVANYLIEKKGIDNVALVCCSMKGQNPLNPDELEKHVFAVVGLDKNAKLSDPSTWGNKAVVLDPWSDIVAPVESENPSYRALNKLYARFRTNFIAFENCAKYIGSTDDPNSKYNWENYQRKQFCNN